MKPRIKIRPLADQNIDDLAAYLAQADLQAAFHFLDEIHATLAHLATTSSPGSPCEFPSPRYQDLRWWPVRTFKKHIIFFRVIPNGIEIVRVLHGARDLTAIFG